MRVEARGDNDKLRPIPIQCGKDFAHEGIQIFLLTASGAHRDVERVPFSFTASGFGAASGSGIKWVLMRADVKNRLVFVKNLLRAVAVVDIPVDDRDPAQAVARLGVARPDGRVIEEAKAH